MEKRDTISRKYAISQIEMAISKEESKEERERLCLIKEFLLALPSVELEQKVNEQLKWERDTAIEQLRSYGIDFGEKVKVIKLPCKVYDTLYDITEPVMREKVVEIIEYMPLPKGDYMFTINGEEAYYSGNIGKTIFFNKEEAEAALKGETKQCAK